MSARRVPQLLIDGYKKKENLECEKETLKTFDSWKIFKLLMNVPIKDSHK
jgi:hypothetical protein